MRSAMASEANTALWRYSDLDQSPYVFVFQLRPVDYGFVFEDNSVFLSLTFFPSNKG
jgi:hypothetical protein